MKLLRMQSLVIEAAINGPTSEGVEPAGAAYLPDPIRVCPLLQLRSHASRARQGRSGVARIQGKDLGRVIAFPEVRGLHQRFARVAA